VLKVQILQSGEGSVSFSVSVVQLAVNRVHLILDPTAGGEASARTKKKSRPREDRNQESCSFPQKVNLPA
jgi:hypothetical protein